MARRHTRKAIILASLMGVLTVTSGLLMAVAPAPLAAPMALSNSATVTSTAPLPQTRWTRILIRDSRTPAGNAQSLAHPTAGVGDHFVVCNGSGGGDGEIQIASRWSNQLPALPPAGLSQIDPGWISICVVGRPGERTPNQAIRVKQLVDTLCKQWNISPQQVMTMR